MEIKLIDGDREYILFNLRENEIITYEDFETTVFILKECRKYFSKGDVVYGKLGEFFSRLPYVHFNYLVIRSVDDDEPLVTFKNDPVLSIGGIVYQHETDHDFNMKVLYYLMKEMKK